MIGSPSTAPSNSQTRHRGDRRSISPLIHSNSSTSRSSRRNGGALSQHFTIDMQHQQRPQHQPDAPWGVSSQRFSLDLQHQQRPQKQPSAPWGVSSQRFSPDLQHLQSPQQHQQRLQQQPEAPWGVSSQRFPWDLQQQQRPQKQPGAPWGASSQRSSLDLHHQQRPQQHQQCPSTSQTRHRGYRHIGFPLICGTSSAPEAARRAMEGIVTAVLP